MQLGSCCETFRVKILVLRVWKFLISTAPTIVGNVRGSALEDTACTSLPASKSYRELRLGMGIVLSPISMHANDVSLFQDVEGRSFPKSDGQDVRISRRMVLIA